MKNDNIFRKTISISETIGIFSPEILNHPNHKRWDEEELYVQKDVTD